MAVSHENGVQLRERVRLCGGLGVSFQERIDEHAMGSIIDFPAVVAVVVKSHHAQSSCLNGVKIQL